MLPSVADVVPSCRASASQEEDHYPLVATETLLARGELLFPFHRTTRDELLKIRKELQIQRRGGGSSNKPPMSSSSKERQDWERSKRAETEPKLLSDPGAMITKGVRFAEPIVTDVRHRPYTRPEDIEKLYFIEEELDELEWDRANVEGDQFEVALKKGEGTPEKAVPSEEMEAISWKKDSISVMYKNKRSILEQSRDFSSTDISMSPSDLSAIYE